MESTSWTAPSLAALILAGCALSLPPADSGPADGTIRFVDRARELGLGGISYPADLGKAKIIATMGAGVAWGDADADGDLDLYVTQGIPRYRPDEVPSHCGLLFRNDGGERFVEVSRRLGLRACGWGSGAVFEDVDGDGRIDLFLTFVGDNQLWLGQDDGSFLEVGGAAGIRAPGYNCGAAIFDLEGDGDSDVYVTRYVETTVEAETTWPGLDLRMPEDYPAPDNVLLRNDGGGRFTEATAQAGVADAGGRSLGVVAADLDLDGLADLYVANDRGPNTLFHNRGDGTFEDATALAGLGNGRDGQWESAMGLAVGDVDGDGLPDVLVTNYVDEPNTLFVNLGELVFEDRTRSHGLFEAAYDWVGWGTELVDFDNDGRLDLYVANGHIIPDRISRLGALLSRDPLVKAYAKGGYRQPLLVFRGLERRFALVEEAGAAAGLLAARGAATVDLDRDGRLDLFVMSLPRKAPAVLLANRTQPAGRWLALDLRPPGAAPPPVGTRIEIVTSGGSQFRQVVSGGSYLSSSAGPIHVGLGAAANAEVALRGTDGTSVRFLDLPADRFFVVGSVRPRTGIDPPTRDPDALVAQ